MSEKACVNGLRGDPFFGFRGVTCGWKESDMDCTFHDEERQPRTVLRARSVAAERQATMTDEERERVICAVIAALDPFPEAREAVLAALRSGAEGGRDRLE